MLEDASSPGVRVTEAAMQKLDELLRHAPALAIETACPPPPHEYLSSPEMLPATMRLAAGRMQWRPAALGWCAFTSAADTQAGLFTLWLYFAVIQQAARRAGLDRLDAAFALCAVAYQLLFIRLWLGPGAGRLSVSKCPPQERNRPAAADAPAETGRLGWWWWCDPVRTGPVLSKRAARAKAVTCSACTGHARTAMPCTARP